MGKKKVGQSGVSMMEVMIAVVIAAALSAVAAPNWQKAADKRRADRALAALMTISECIKQYKVEYHLATVTPMTYGSLESYGCVSRNDYPSGYQFPPATEAIQDGSARIIKSNDNTRMVCVTTLGNPNAATPASYIDAPNAATCSTANPYYRVIREDQIGKQRGS